MKQARHRISVRTSGRGFFEITGEIAKWLGGAGITDGLLTVFIQHTSASLLIQENADADVVADLESAFERLAPESPRLYRHTLEGPDDMPAHIRAALTQSSLSIPIERGQMALGTWQGVYVFEHRRSPHQRSVLLHAVGE